MLTLASSPSRDNADTRVDIDRNYYFFFFPVNFAIVALFPFQFRMRNALCEIYISRWYGLSSDYSSESVVGFINKVKISATFCSFVNALRLRSSKTNGNFRQLQLYFVHVRADWFHKRYDSSVSIFARLRLRCDYVLRRVSHVEFGEAHYENNFFKNIAKLSPQRYCGAVFAEVFAERSSASS